MTCPCGKPSRGFHYRKDGKDIPACSMRCLDRIVELKGIIPQPTEQK